MLLFSDAESISLQSIVSFNCDVPILLLNHTIDCNFTRIKLKMPAANTTVTSIAEIKCHSVDSYYNTVADAMKVVHLEEKQLTVMDSGHAYC